MIDIDIKQRAANGPNYKLFKKKVPALPREGDHMSSDMDGFSGYVKRTMFWWNEQGKLVIEVEIK
ncbi:hypothetical protein [Rhizobium azibense]|uniref:Uncharacterized protein n=1 Tax=Rhizobium azibense TaxID=1136135 RepID=A0A4R3RF11_9HYPH|nr:hypothetical protein [Rhizobium azibense]TCU34138.1 hypothetical protein EV129_113122 [Rhizobium azibense]